MSILSPDQSSSRVHTRNDQSQGMKTLLTKKPQNPKNLHIPYSDDTTASKLEEAITSNQFNVIFIESPVTQEYYTIQKLLWKLKQNTSCSVFTNYSLRRLPDIQKLKQNIDQLTASGVKITSIFIEIVLKSTSPSRKGSILSLDHQYLDLLLYLTNTDIKTVQSSMSCEEDSSLLSFISLSGKLSSRSPYSLLIRTQGEKETSVGVRVTFQNEEVVNSMVKYYGEEVKPSSQDIEGFFSSFNEGSKTWKQFASLEDVRKVIRFSQCAQFSLENQKVVTLKKLENDLIPVLTIGTGTFLGTGLWVPVSQRKSLVFTGIFSKNKERVKRIFHEVTKRGESLEYISSYEDLMNYSYQGKYKPIFYTLSIPGTRKYQEMVDALKAGYYVLAEKPAFANADDGKKFREKINNELDKRLFFGWHYQHHYIFQKIWKDVSNNTYGRIKHIRTYFSISKLLDKSRIFEPSQGGVGLDVFSYNLHCTLRLNGFNHGLKSIKSNIKSAQDFDLTNPDLKIIDFIMDVQLEFDNGATADLYATFEHTTTHSTTLEITFEDGTQIFYKEYQHVQAILNTGLCPVVIKKPGEAKWEEYITEEDKAHPDYYKSTYDHQIEFMERLSKGEEHYDMGKDIGGLSTESNIKLHEVLDEIFLKGGFEKKKGATKDLILKRD